MRAFIVTDFAIQGSTTDRSRPEPSEGEILVRVRAAGVNAIDPLLVSGVLKGFLEHRLPLTPGIEYAGVVEAVGTGVQGLAPGDEVFGGVGKPYFGDGSWAEFVTANAAIAVRRPEDLGVLEAAGLAVTGTSALALLEALGLEPGRTVLIVGAAGGVGTFATQLAAAAGLRVIGVTSGANSAYVHDLGAADVIDYTAGGLPDQVLGRHPDGVDGVIDLYHDVDGLRALAAAVRPGGGIVTPRAPGVEGAFADLPVTAAYVNAAMHRAGEMGELAARGNIRVTISAVVPLDDAASALASQATGKVRGKQVIVIDGSTA